MLLLVCCRGVACSLDLGCAKQSQAIMATRREPYHLSTMCASEGKPVSKPTSLYRVCTSRATTFASRGPLQKREPDEACKCRNVLQLYAGIRRGCESREASPGLPSRDRYGHTCNARNACNGLNENRNRASAVASDKRGPPQRELKCSHCVKRLP